SKNIVNGNVTHMSVVTVTLKKILHTLKQNNAQASPKFKIILTGKKPVPINYLKKAHALNLAITQTYSITKTSSQTAT
ncbi:o-succinylbenzoate--CoA ligase, partial [Lysinibacillus agricola]